MDGLDPANVQNISVHIDLLPAEDKKIHHLIRHAVNHMRQRQDLAQPLSIVVPRQSPTQVFARLQTSLQNGPRRDD